MSYHLSGDQAVWGLSQVFRNNFNGDFTWDKNGPIVAARDVTSTLFTLDHNRDIHLLLLLSLSLSASISPADLVRSSKHNK